MHKGSKLRGALRIPVRSEPDTPFHSYLLAAAEQDIIEERQPGVEFLLTRLAPTTTKADTLRSVAANNFKPLEGGWFKLALVDHLEHRSPFNEICWSVEADCANADSIGETDLVAFNPHSFTLHFIPSKTTAPHGNALDHIQGLRRRATTDRREVQQGRPLDLPPQQTRLSHCEEQDVSLYTFTEEVILK